MRQQFQQDYEMHSDAIFKYIYYLVGNKELTEDLTQETFYKAFQHFHTYRQEPNVQTWLRKIARNLVYDHFRRKKILRFMPFFQKERARDIAMLPEKFLIKGEHFSALFQALFGIKLEYREAIILRYLEELSVKETAEVLGWSEVKVKNNTARGLLALRKWLGEERLVNEELKDLLRQLQDVKRTNAEKEMTWGKLGDRIGRETRCNHWQYRTMFTALLAMLVLFMALLINDSDYTKKNATLPLSKEIRTVHFYETDTANQFNGKGSKLYLGVEKLTSTA